MILLPRETVDALKPDDEGEPYVPRYPGRTGSAQQGGGLLSDLAGIGRRVVPQGVRDRVGDSYGDIGRTGERMLDAFGGGVAQTLGLDAITVSPFVRPPNEPSPPRQLEGLGNTADRFTTAPIRGVLLNPSNPFQGAADAFIDPTQTLLRNSGPGRLFNDVDGPVLGLSPRDVAGGILDVVADPWAIGRAAKTLPKLSRLPARVNALDDAATLARIAGPVERSTRDAFSPTWSESFSPDDFGVRQTPGAVRRATDSDVPRGTRTLGQRPVEAAPVAAPPVRPRSDTGILGETYGIERPAARLSPSQRIEGRVRKAFGYEPLNNPEATPLFQMIPDSKERIRSVGAAAEEEVQVIYRQSFRYNDKEQITDLAGRVEGWPKGPAMQDLREHRSKFEPFLSPQQRADLDAIQEVLTPYDEVARTLNPEIVNKAGIEEGGFYSHHSYVPKRRTQINVGSRGVGGRESFEKTRRFKTVEAAINAGETPKPFDEAVGEYVQQVGNSAVRDFVAAQAKASGRANTAASRISAIKRTSWNKVNAQITRARQTFIKEEVRLKGAADESRRARQTTGQSIGDLANASVRRGSQRAESFITTEDIQMARAAVEDSVAEGRRLSSEIGQNFEQIRNAGGTLTEAERQLGKDVQALDNLAMEVEGARLGAQRSLDRAAALDEGVAPSPFMGPASPADIAEARLAMSGAKALEREYSISLAAADGVEAKISSLTEGAARLSDRVDRLTERGALLKDMDRAARQQYVDVRRTERQANSIERAQAVADREIKLLTRVVERAAGRETAAGAREAGQSLRMIRTQRVLESALARKQAMTAEWERAKELSRQVPTGRLDTGLMELTGVDFPREYGLAAQRIIGRMSRNDKDVMLAWRAVNSILRFSGSTLDASYAFVTALFGTYLDPRAWGTGMKVAVNTFWNSDAAANHAAAFNQRAIAAGTPTIREYAARGLHQVGSGGDEFTGAGIGERLQGFITSPIPFTSRVVEGGLNPFRGSNRSWNTFGDVFRREVADTSYSIKAARGPLDAEARAVALSDITRSANRLSGWSDTRFGGDWGDLITFAPRFFQSTLENIADAAGGVVPARGLLSQFTPLSAEATMTQEQARNAILRTIGLGTAMTFALNEARGKDTDVRLFVDGHINPNFMRVVDFLGRDWSVFGQLDRLVPLTAIAFNGEQWKAARSLANSPLAGRLLDLAVGSNVVGERTRDEGKMPDWGDIGKLGLQSGPFAGREYGSGVTQTLAGEYPEAAGSVFAGLGGLRNAPITISDQLNKIAREKHNVDYNDLKPKQRMDIDDQNPDLIKERSDARIRRAGPYGNYEQIKQKYAAEQAEADTSIADSRAWRANRRERQQRLIGAREVIFGPDSKPDLSTPWGQWGDQIKKNTTAGVIDWDAVDEWRAGLDPAEDREIDDETGLGGTPREREYSQTGRELKKSGYFDIYNQVWQWVSKEYDLSEYKTGRQFEKAMSANARDWLVKKGITSRAEQDILMELLLDEIDETKVYRALAQEVQEEWIKANVGLTKKAIETGYINPSTLRNAEIRAIFAEGRR